MPLFNSENILKKWLLVSCMMLSLCGMIFSATLFADSDPHKIRKLVKQGKILPLQQIIDHLDPTHKGRILEVELERERGRYIYEINMLGAKGRVWEYEIDAASGEILEQERED